jgi:hypothetical protein
MSGSAKFEQLKPGQLAMWGSAAWAQTQLTPGVSTLAAPRPIRQLRRFCADCDD